MAAWACAAPLLAQTTAAAAPSAASLDEVDALIAEGRTEDARAALVAWTGTDSGDAAGHRGGRAVSRADAQRALWLRALLTVDPTQAAVDYQRLVVEYPGGPYSDRALLRLAQGAEAQGDPGRARSLLTSLLRDYPASPLRLDAGTLLASLAAGAVPPAKGAEPAAESARPSATATRPPANGRWTVQVGAFASSQRASARRDELTAAGIEARVVLVPGSPLVRVRVGRFASQPEADRARDRLTADGQQATVAGDADREEPVP